MSPRLRIANRDTVIITSVVSLGLMLVAMLAGSAGLLGRSETEVDVNSGRLRVRVFFFGIIVSDREEGTEFSRALARNDLQDAPADYRFAYNSFVGLQKLFGGPFEFSIYGEALATLRTAVAVFESRASRPESDRERLAELKEMLQAGDVRGMIVLVDGLIEEIP
jgi:hypothetical protein